MKTKAVAERASCARRLCCTAALSFVLFFGQPGQAAVESVDHLQQAVALISQGDLQGAEQEARLALEDPTTRAVAWATLGTIRLQQKKFAESREFLLKALQLDPKLLGARLNLGQVYLLQGKTAEARGVFREALKIDPASPNARFSLAQLEAGSGDYKTSLELLKPIAPALTGSPEGIQLLTMDYLGLGRKEEARTLASKWKELTDVPPAFSINYAGLLLRYELKEEAISVLEKARRAGPPSFELASSLAESYLLSGELDKAEENYVVAASLDTDCVLCYRQLAWIANRQGDTEKALAYLIKAKRLDPENPDVLFEFGKVCLERDLFRDALPALEQAAQLRPNDDRYTYILATAYGMKLRFKESLELFRRLLKKQPEDPILNYAVGSVLYIEGKDLDGAEKYLRKSISLQPAQLAAYYYLGMVVLKKGDQDQAAEIFRDVLKRYPDHIPSLEQLSIMLVRKRNYDEAQQILDKVLRLDPDSRIGHYQLSLLLGRLGQKEEAARHMEISQQLEAEEKKKVKTELYLMTPH